MSTWIFLRGLTRESRHWGNFPARFRTAFPDAKVITPNLPGNGQRYREPSPTSVASMAEQCRAELLAQGCQPPYHLLAMSLGAMVAVAWAERYPQELAGCVLINTSLRPFSPFYRRLRPANYATLLRHLLGPTGSPETREADILRMTSQLTEHRAEIVEAWSAWQREFPITRRNALRQLWAASRYHAPTTRPDVPMLILASAADTLVDPGCSRRLAQRWQNDQQTYAEHPAAGHDLPLDDAEWVIGQVREWQRKNDRPLRRALP